MSRGPRFINMFVSHVEGYDLSTCLSTLLWEKLFTSLQVFWATLEEYNLITDVGGYGEEHDSGWFISSFERLVKGSNRN